MCPETLERSSMDFTDLNEFCPCNRKATHVVLYLIKSEDGIFALARCHRCGREDAHDTGYRLYTRREAVRLMQEYEEGIAERKRKEVLGSNSESKGRFPLGPLLKKELGRQGKA